MSREIKFRAWNGKSMVEPYSVRNGKAFIIRPCNQNDPVIKGTDGANYYKNWDVDVATDYPLMQFTGLRDANGVEIYEGDIVKHKHADINRGIIMFNTDNFAGLPAFHVCSKDGESVGYYYGVVADDSYIVIGNIYEHPYLLEGSK